jgi:hypothetical protein
MNESLQHSSVNADIYALEPTGSQKALHNFLRIHIEPLSSLSASRREQMSEKERAPMDSLKIDRQTARALVLLSAAYFVQATTALCIVGVSIKPAGAREK